MSRIIRLAAIDTASARPLVHGIECGPWRDDFSLVLDSAEGCARRLRESDVDLALLPSWSYHALSLDPALDLRVLPGIAVVVRGPLPHASAKEQSLGPLPGTVEAWREQSGLPFVSAIWVGRAGAIEAEVGRVLLDAHDWGLLQASLGAGPDLEHSPGPQPAPAPSASGLSYVLDAHALSGLAAFLEHLRLAGGISKVTRVRLFDFAYEPEQPAPVTWPRPTPSTREPPLHTLLTRAAAGGRLSPDEGLRLYESAPLHELGQAADERRKRLHPDHRVTYIVERNVNYTNLCVTACKFCNFYRPPKSREGYTLPREVLAEKFSETVAMGGIQILLQGGVNPALPLSYYEELFRWTKANFPLALHALSPEEISFIAKREERSIREVLLRLVDAGLDSLPGGGAEILDDEIRHRISPLKCRVATWLEVMREAHRIGLRSTGTMVFGFGESPKHLLSHLERLRALQDQTSGFTAFICWPFQSEGTRLRPKDDTSAHRYLRIFALGRLYLDNFPNLQVSWPTLGPEIGQVALRFGGNDFGSTMIEENVVSQAGAVFRLSAEDIERWVRAAGFTPRRRNMRYELLPEHEPATELTRSDLSPGSAWRPRLRRDAATSVHLLAPKD